jgi:hypothetical protein
VKTADLNIILRLGLVDYEHVDGGFGRHQLQSKLVLDGLLELGAVSTAPGGTVLI